MLSVFSAKAKTVTLIVFIALVLCCFIALIIGIIFVPDNPLVALEGMRMIAEIIFPYFALPSGGVALTGIAAKVMEKVNEGKQIQKESYGEDDQ